jgi:DNA-binding NtrC family response regulator
VPITVDVRVVAATHKRLDAEIAAGRFRDDLYYRLAVAVLEVPPLRGRGDDVVRMARMFLARLARRAGKPVADFSPDALDALRAYHWPGNVRQLRNEIERALLLEEGPLLELEDLGLRAPATLAERRAQLDAAAAELRERALAEACGDEAAAARLLGVSPERVHAGLALPEPGSARMLVVERQLIDSTLKDAKGNIQAAARSLGVSRGTLYRKMKRHKLEPG